MSYATDHAGAYADVLAAGASVLITSTTPSYNAATGRSTPSVSTMDGAALETDGERRWLVELGLVQTTAHVLLFAPATYGDVAPLGGELTWGGHDVVIRGVKPAAAPDGVSICSYLAVER